MLTDRAGSSWQALREPWWVLPAEVLHGLTFAAMWAATTDYAHQIAPGIALYSASKVSALPTELRLSSPAPRQVLVCGA